MTLTADLLFNAFGVFFLFFAAFQPLLAPASRVQWHWLGFALLALAAVF